MELTPEQLARADLWRSWLAARGKRPKIGFELVDCDIPGIEGTLTKVSPTGAIIYVKCAHAKEVIEVPNRAIVHWERR